MDMTMLLAAFFAGIFLINSIPHLVSSLRGEAFPTPFAKPSAVGFSTPLANFAWGIINGVVGYYLLTLAPPMAPFGLAFCLFAAGAIIMGLYLVLHFTRVRQDMPPHRNRSG